MKNNISTRTGNKRISLRQKLLFVIVPIIILCYVITYVVTMRQTRSLLKQDAEEIMENASTSVNYQVSNDLMQTYGILENVRASIQNFCHSTDEIREYGLRMKTGLWRSAPGIRMDCIVMILLLEKCIWMPIPESILFPSIVT